MLRKYRPLFRGLSRAYSTAPLDIGFVFDIDGVLIRGGKSLPHALPALQLLERLKVPYILLTNGGGKSELTRVRDLSARIGTQLHPAQIVQSHTPCKALVNDPQFERVLVIGGRGNEAREVALQYGFKEALTPIDAVRANGSIYPFHSYTEEQLEDIAMHPSESHLYGGSAKPISAILVFSDPRDFGTATQISMDLLNSEEGYFGTKRGNAQLVGNATPSIPIIFSNNDFLWANEYPVLRFGQGAFRITMEALYREMNKAELQSTILGKPFKVSYDYAHHVLIDWSRRLGSEIQPETQVLPQLNVAPVQSPFKKVYMVGDNPESDILGANNYGWESLLLRTGVFRDEDWDSIVAKPTGGVFDHVEEAVRFALTKNRLL
ncbi:hypothetical protein BABINDRAFT_34248 [Babjeviella inositovora NRRL Y-12698]|uniref:TIGR01456 family HAD hydrolase n=1 Tax=Babjeviella inositovora NRRL Y-12698 TaxID=984486 RepID=A0A1E3QTZ7_9ASCO|nr:uncharacterized protein BABINDRAFT_34248 [Babjeviella inositovora NRRL Y-12698]ODQ81161.1 hypothetical protein BABINDRAFT_34248 [Babjeviella inositovora NRRL Y-12698]